MRRLMVMAALATLGMNAPAQPPAIAAMTKTGAKGLAIAVIDHGRVVSVQAFGQRNLKGDSLTTRTTMYAASLTKAMFAYYVLQLVDAGRLDLDRPIASYLNKPLPEYGNLPRNMGHWATWPATSAGGGSPRGWR